MFWLLSKLGTSLESMNGADRFDRVACASDAESSVKRRSACAVCRGAANDLFKFCSDAGFCFVTGCILKKRITPAGGF